MKNLEFKFEHKAMLRKVCGKIYGGSYSPPVYENKIVYIYPQDGLEGGKYGIDPIIAHWFELVFWVIPNEINENEKLFNYKKGKYDYYRNSMVAHMNEKKEFIHPVEFMYNTIIKKEDNGES